MADEREANSPDLHGTSTSQHNAAQDGTRQRSYALDDGTGTRVQMQEMAKIDGARDSRRGLKSVETTRHQPKINA